VNSYSIRQESVRSVVNVVSCDRCSKVERYPPKNGSCEDVTGFVAVSMNGWLAREKGAIVVRRGGNQERRLCDEADPLGIDQRSERKSMSPSINKMRHD